MEFTELIRTRSTRDSRTEVARRLPWRESSVAAVALSVARCLYPTTPPFKKIARRQSLLSAIDV